MRRFCKRQDRYDPSPVAIGVTPKSYGYFHANDMEKEGRSFLDGTAVRAGTGTNINIGWLSAATALERSVGGDLGLESIVAATDLFRLRMSTDACAWRKRRSRGGAQASARAPVVRALDLPGSQCSSRAGSACATAAGESGACESCRRSRRSTPGAGHEFDHPGRLTETFSTSTTRAPRPRLRPRRRSAVGRTRSC